MTRIARPAHPGQFIRMEILEPLGLSVTAAAKILGVTRPALSTLLNGHGSLSPDMALRVEKAFGPKMDTLLRDQFKQDKMILSDGLSDGSLHVERPLIDMVPVLEKIKNYHCLFL